MNRRKWLFLTLLLSLLIGLGKGWGAYPAAKAAGSPQLVVKDTEAGIVIAVEKDGETSTVATLPPEEAVLPMFRPFITLSPDGKYVTYVVSPNAVQGTRVSLYNAELWLVDVDSHKAKMVRSFPRELWPAPFQWAPDSKRFFFLQTDGALVPNLRIGWVDALSAQTSLLPTDSLLDVDLWYHNRLRFRWDSPTAITYEILDFLMGEKTVVTYDLTRKTREQQTLPLSETEQPGGIYATLPCDVPLYSQQDPRWKNDVMHTCNLTIGQAGCAVTSTAMTFKYYGKDTDPHLLNQCLGDYACPIYWNVAANSCSSGKVSYQGSAGFSWSTMENELAAGRPPILYMCKQGCDHYTHFVVVVSGQGSGASNYTINDSWDGQEKPLTSYTDRGWTLEGLRLYRGTPQCDHQAPQTQASLSGVAGNANWYRSEVTVTLTAQDEEGGSGVKKIVYRVNGGSPQTVEDSTVSFTLSDEGLYSIVYYATDNAGNQSHPKAMNFGIDATPPQGTIIINNGEGSAASAVVHAHVAVTDEVSKPSGIRWHINDEAWTAWQPWREDFNWTLPNPIPGQSYTFAVQFQDHAGNLSSVYTQTLTFQPPTTSPASPNFVMSNASWGISAQAGASGDTHLHGTWGEPAAVGNLASNNYRLTLGYWERLPLFLDVSPTFWARGWIETLADAGITSGCGNGMYCPDNVVTRAQMAAFLERGIHGADYQPPEVEHSRFGDVADDYWAKNWIEALVNDGITSGCGNGNFCPGQPVTRAQMAVFLLRAEHGADYTPPHVEHSQFNDIADDFWAKDWIDQLANEGITSGCGNGNYCPTNSVTRAQMAVFLVRAFGLTSP